MKIRLLSAAMITALLSILSAPSALAQTFDGYEEEEAELIAPRKPRPPNEAACAAAPSFPLKEICRITNVERRKRGLPEMHWDSRLAKVAQGHARDMHLRDYFSHTTPEGRTMKDRLVRGGVSYSWSGENIAWGYETPEKFMGAWMRSRGHRQNILHSKFTRIGVGWAGKKVVQNFTDGGRD